MLKTLIGRKDLKRLQLYIIAASFPKMLHRITNNRVSVKYFDCLQDMKLDTISFTEPPKVATTGPDSEINPDKLFLDILPGLTKVTEITDISNLLSVRDKGTGKSLETPPEIYNKDTFMEFHNLLCQLLLQFRKSLEALQNIQKEKKLGKKTWTLENTMGELRSVWSLGLSLRAMVTGAAIEKHLKTIAHLLKVEYGKSRMAAAEDEEADNEFDALEPYSMH